MKNKRNKGITLIALVVTIIVLLILAGISISMLSGDNGILQRATDAKTNTERTNVIEQARTDILDYQIKNKGAKIDKFQLKKVLDTYFKDVPAEVNLPDGEELLNLNLTTLDKYGTHQIKVYEIYNENITKNELPEITKVYATVSEEGELIFSNNEEDINEYMIINNTTIAEYYEIEEISNTKFQEEFYDEEHDTWIGGMPLWKGDSNIHYAIILNNIVPKYTAYWFCELMELTEINGIHNLITSRVTDMSYMFCACCNLETINLSNFDTSLVTNMSHMFGSVNDEYPMIFKDLNLSRFNTSLVVNMSGMFCECSDLENLNLNNFDTSRVIDMSMMFMNCYRLNALDLRSFDTRNVENMHDMFNGCCSIKDFNISSFRTGKVTDMSGMFGKLRRWLTNDETIDLDLTFFDTSMVINMNAMFMDSNFKTIDLSSFNTSQVTSMLSMFSGCSKLETIYASSNFVTYLVNNSDYMFSGCVNLTGGNGTHLSLYDSHSTYTYDKTHARIDTPEERGYFTEKITNLNV